MSYQHRNNHNQDTYSSRGNGNGFDGRDSSQETQNIQPSIAPLHPAFIAPQLSLDQLMSFKFPDGTYQGGYIKALLNQAFVLGMLARDHPIAPLPHRCQDTVAQQEEEAEVTDQDMAEGDSARGADPLQPEPTTQKTARDEDFPIDINADKPEKSIQDDFPFTGPKFSALPETPLVDQDPFAFTGRTAFSANPAPPSQAYQFVGSDPKYFGHKNIPLGPDGGRGVAKPTLPP